MNKLLLALVTSVFMASMSFNVAASDATDANVMADYKIAVAECKKKPITEQKICLRNAKAVRDMAIKDAKKTRTKDQVETSTVKKTATIESNPGKKKAIANTTATQEKATKATAKKDKTTKDIRTKEKATQEKAIKEKSTKENAMKEKTEAAEKAAK